MNSCIGSKEELVAKQLLNGAMVTMNHDTTDCMEGGDKNSNLKMTLRFLLSVPDFVLKVTVNLNSSLLLSSKKYF